MKLLLSAIGLARVSEGASYPLAPATMRRMAEVLPHRSEFFWKGSGWGVIGIGISILPCARLGAGG